MYIYSEQDVMKLLDMEPAIESTDTVSATESSIWGRHRQLKNISDWDPVAGHIDGFNGSPGARPVRAVLSGFPKEIDPEREFDMFTANLDVALNGTREQRESRADGSRHADYYITYDARSAEDMQQKEQRYDQKTRTWPRDENGFPLYTNAPDPLKTKEYYSRRPGTAVVIIEVGIGGLDELDPAIKDSVALIKWQKAQQKIEKVWNATLPNFEVWATRVIRFYGSFIDGKHKPLFPEIVIKSELDSMSDDQYNRVWREVYNKTQEKRTGQKAGQSYEAVTEGMLDRFPHSTGRASTFCDSWDPNINLIYQPAEELLNAINKKLTYNVNLDDSYIGYGNDPDEPQVGIRGYDPDEYNGLIRVQLQCIDNSTEGKNAVVLQMNQILRELYEVTDFVEEHNILFILELPNNPGDVDDNDFDYDSNIKGFPKLKVY